MKTIAIIQARMRSSRLPGKVMMLLAGRTVLDHTIERVRSCSLLDGVVVATTTAERDDVIVAEAVRCGAGVFRGSESDVLARYYQAATGVSADVVVRVTSDCPLFDGQLLTEMLERFQAKTPAGAIDYLSNSLKRTFPRGLDAEVFTIAVLKCAYENATTPSEREHVTPYLYRHPERFNLQNYSRGGDLSAYRWTLDTREDYEMLSAVYLHLYRPGTIFSTSDVLELLATRPDVAALNDNIKQKELGY